MSRYWLGRSAGSWTARLAAMVAIALVAGFTAAQQGTVTGPGTAQTGALTVGAGAAVLTRPASAITVSFARGRTETLEIRLDELLDRLGESRRAVLDRESLVELAQSALDTDEPVEHMRLGEVLEEIPRVRIETDGRSIVLGPRAIRLLARLALGRGAGQVNDVTVGEILDALPSVGLDEDGTPERLGRRWRRAFEALFGSIQRVDHSRDPQFLARRELERRYEEIVQLVKELRLEGFVGDGDRDAVYDEAYNRLLAENREDAIPLLDAHLRLQEEYENADLSGMSHAERIQFRWEARRWAFGEETADVLFARQEAMERYQVDKLALEADTYSAPRVKARRLSERREELKVELARIGSYVGFPEEARSAVSRTPQPDATEIEDETEDDSRRRFQRRRQR